MIQRHFRPLHHLPQYKAGSNTAYPFDLVKLIQQKFLIVIHIWHYHLQQVVCIRTGNQ